MTRCWALVSAAAILLAGCTGATSNTDPTSVETSQPSPTLSALTRNLLDSLNDESAQTSDPELWALLKSSIESSDETVARDLRELDSAWTVTEEDIATFRTETCSGGTGLAAAYDLLNKLPGIRVNALVYLNRTIGRVAEECRGIPADVVTSVSNVFLETIRTNEAAADTSAPAPDVALTTDEQTLYQAACAGGTAGLGALAQKRWQSGKGAIALAIALAAGGVLCPSLIGEAQP